MSAYKKYNREIHKEFGYRATWALGDPMRLGDIGSLENGVFRQESTLTDFGIEGMKVRTGSVLEDYNFESSGGVNISLKASGEAEIPGSQLGKADAGFSIGFSKSYSVVCRISKPQESKITNMAQLSEQILRLHEQGKWNKDWVLVTSVVKSAAATIIISGEKEGHIDINAKGEASVNDADLTNLDAGLEVKWTKNIAQKLIAKAETTPLYRIHGVKKGWFSGPKFTAKKSAETLSDADKANMTEGHSVETITPDDDE